VGGSSGSDGIHSDGEVYDCAQNEWTLLPLQMVGEDQVLAGACAYQEGRQCAALVPVAGGMLILRAHADDRSVEAELWDEESAQWLTLPYGMFAERWGGFAVAVSVPVGAL
jgi:hypothetical protein